MSIQAEIIAVGSELLSPARTETNSLFLTDRLNSLGILVRRKTVVGDRREDIAEALARALQFSDIVIFTGGLGPTRDDLTREAVAESLSRRLQPEPKLLERLESFYRRLGLKMSDNNRRQAMVPEGAEILDNPRGTAPGLFLRQAERLIFLLPGPPRELKPMVDRLVVGLIRQHKPVFQLHRRQLRLASLGESAVDARVAPIYRRYPEIETTILSSPGIIDLWFQWRGGGDRAEADRQLDELVNRVRAKMGRHVFAEGPQTLAEAVGELLHARGLSLASAESCTGGLIGKLLTDVPGSSRYYLGGVVSYSDRLKELYLGVRESTLKEFGAVSAEVAGEMCEGICRRTGAEVGLSVTGIAGPEGGTAEKPVGLVFFGLADRGKVQVKKRQMPGERETVRLRSARFALDWLRRHLS